MYFCTATPISRQVLASVSTGLVMAGTMTTIGYPAAALPQMERSDSPINFSVDQASWFATITLMMCIPGPLIGANVNEHFGPRCGMLTLLPLLFFSTLAMVFASSKTVQIAGYAEIILLSSRAIQGLTSAVLTPLIYVYTYEMCDQNIRGMMTSFTEMWATVGYLLCYIAGCFLSWEIIALLLPCVTLLPAFIGLCLSEESPQWLVRKQRTKEASEVLRKVRWTEKEITSELGTDINEFENKERTFIDTLKNMSKSSNVLAIIASSLVLCMNQMSGFNIIVIYINHIFSATGVGLDPRWSSVIVGIFRMIASTIGSFLLHKFSRRFMLLSGNLLTASASTIIGVFFYLQTIEDVSHLGWMPLFGLLIYMIGFAGAIGPTTWTVSVEVLPGEVRSIGFGIGNTLYYITAFTLSKSFVSLQNQIGLHGVFWIFSCGSLQFILIIISYIPETYGKTLQDVKDYWNNWKVSKICYDNGIKSVP